MPIATFVSQGMLSSEKYQKTLNNVLFFTTVYELVHHHKYLKNRY